VLDDVVAYVRNDRPRVDPSDGLHYMLGRVEARTGYDVISLASNASDHLTVHIDAYDRQLQAIQARLDRHELDDLTATMDLSDAELRSLTEEARDVLPDVHRELRIIETDLSLYESPAESRAVQHLESWSEHLFGHLNSLRVRARLPLIAAGFGLALVAVATVRQQRRESRVASARVRTVAIDLTVAGTAAFVLAKLCARPGFESVIADAVDAPGATAVLDDVIASLTQGVAQTVERLAFVATAIGSAGIIAAQQAAPSGEGRRPRLRPPLAVAVAAALGLSAANSIDSYARSGDTLYCNGHAELCDRPFDSVTFAATHNSMASSAEGFWFPHQDLDIAGQLELGVRAFLIDTHEWSPLLEKDTIDALHDELPPEVGSHVADALRPLAMTRPGTYLCHQSCALGSVDLTEQLMQIRQFLSTARHNMVTLIIEDDIAVDRTRAAFETAGLLSRIYRHPPGSVWPTLGELIASNRRLVVFEESQRGIFGDAFEHMQETPYNNKQRSELTCAPNRGGTDKPLFLLNHWIDRPVPDRTDAVQLNNRHTLIDRATMCATQRNARPNFLAVNFAGIGHVIQATAALNQLEGQAASTSPQHSDRPDHWPWRRGRERSRLDGTSNMVSPKPPRSGAQHSQVSSMTASRTAKISPTAGSGSHTSFT
jgi:hypothetical protein